MLKYKNLFLRPGLAGFSGSHWRERIFSSRLTWKASCLPTYLNASDLSATKGLHLRVPIRHKGLADNKISSEFVEPMENNKTVEENKTDSHSPSAYDTAMEALSSLISGKKRGDGSAVSDKYNKLERMSMYIKILDLEEDTAGLKIIHVAGTKGKGSTCAFCEAILRECGFRTGLFTSPHLIDVRERFRVDGLDISEEKFLHYFWECWHQLKENITDDLPMPPLFQFLTVLAFKIFASEKVDVAIMEVGLGGARDSTNVIKDPVVCGVSPLGMDHMETLGDTLGKIASQKAGIFKSKVPAFTVPQLCEAMAVLEEKAGDLMVPLEVVSALDNRKLKGKKLSLSGDHQLTNAGLAVALCKSWLRRTGNWEKLFQHADPEENLPEPFLKGLCTAHLLGRAQTVHDSHLKSSDSDSGDLVFYLDGAHSPESMEACAGWFSSAVKDKHNPASAGLNKVWSNGHARPGKNDSTKISKNILLFNCMDVRDPQILLPTLVNTCSLSGIYFTKAIFVPSISTYSKVTSGSSAVPLEAPSKDLTWQFNLQKVWEKIIHGKDAICNSSEVRRPETTPPRSFVLDDDILNCRPVEGNYTCSAVVSSLPMTINWLRSYSKENPAYRIQVLVTGSLHLVGDVLKLLRR